MPQTRRRGPAHWLAALILPLVMSVTVRAAETQSYRVDLSDTGDSTIDELLKSTSNLVTLRRSAPVSPLGLIARARGDIDRLKTVLESYGYYQSKVTVQIDGMDLNDPGLADKLQALPRNQDARVMVNFTLGPLYRLGDVKVEGTLPPGIQLGLASGAPAVARDVLTAGAHLLTILQTRGYAFAKVPPPVAYEDLKEPVLDVTFKVDAGPKVNIGEIHIQGLKRVNESMVRRRLLVHTGELYNALAVEHARLDLLRMAQVFSGVTVQLGQQVDETGGVPITFVVQERARRSVGFNIAYSTDLGGSAGVNWADRNLLRNGEQLEVSASLLNITGGDTTGVGYNSSIKLILPDFGHRDQQLQFAVGATRQFLIAYDQTAISASVTLSRKLSSLWTASAGIAAAEEEILQAGAHDHYALVQLPLTLTYDSTDLATPLADPTHGMRNQLIVTPTQSFGTPSAQFLIAQLKLIGYFDLAELFDIRPGRSVIAARGLTGRALGAGGFSLPPDQRFYMGGSGTIRGYPYQGVGPQIVETCTGEIPISIRAATTSPAFRSTLPPGGEYVQNCTPIEGIPLGGTSFFAAGLEFRQRIVGNWGMAAFIDGGQVRTPLEPSPQLTGVPGSFFVGVGAGVRYYTPIGPVRVDFGLPLRIYTTDGARYQVYIGLGQAF